jgi:leader peptidase (prepilin peptidase)/N-methyltransferase
VVGELPGVAATAVAAGLLAPVAERLAQGAWARPRLGAVAGFAGAGALAAAWAAAVTDGWPFALGCALALALLLLAEVDRRTMMLPDMVTLPLITAGLVVAATLAPARWSDHVTGALAGFAALAGIAWAYARLRGREGLGLGDAKLLAAAGAWLGWQALPGVVLIGAAGALIAALIGRARGRPLSAFQAVPFGPTLALGLWIGWLYGPIGLGW